MEKLYEHFQTVPFGYGNVRLCLGISVYGMSVSVCRTSISKCVQFYRYGGEQNFSGTGKQGGYKDTYDFFAAKTPYQSFQPP